jgi:hypothetical protein
MSSSILPFSLQLPPGYGFPTGNSAAQVADPSRGSASPTDATSTSTPVDIVSISNAFDAGAFTAVAGDIFRMSDLFKAGAPTDQTIAGFRVALGGVAAGDAGGTLWLDGKDVTARTSFTADEFAHLTYNTTGASGAQSLVVIAQTGTRQPNRPDGSLGPLSREVDSAAVQVTATVNATGSRSINAMNALVNQPEG